MVNETIKKYFEEKYLKNTCFSTLDELLNDKTLVEVNAPRALIAVDLVGIWKGLNDKGLISNILLRIDEFEKDIKEFQNFGVKSKVIIRLNQLRKEIVMLE